ncbi:MAG: hypothetical protein ABSH41_30335 [Syntrophobacteraceae bacterium]
MKPKTAIQIILAVALVFMSASFAQASSATATGSVSLTAEIAPLAELTLGTGTVDFPNTTPTGNGTLTAAVTTAVTANVRTAGGATLVATAATDLTSGSDTIDIANVSSTIDAGGGFFATGAQPMSKSGVTVGGGTSGNYTGTWTWKFTNQWSYKTGNYSATINYLLTAP